MVHHMIRVDLQAGTTMFWGTFSLENPGISGGSPITEHGTTAPTPFVRFVYLFLVQAI